MVAAKELDRGNQRDVEAADGKPIGQPAGQVVDHVHAQAREAMHERLGVEVLDRTDASGMPRLRFARRLCQAMAHRMAEGSEVP